mmetsp:Transcript_54422/g.74395  ORF Transcript_54422/g.74395 Transcript_54422/m.74395 type:complete len:146 (-) Transcript_54422:989-1426(-)
MEYYTWNESGPPAGETNFPWSAEHNEIWESIVKLSLKENNDVDVAKSGVVQVPEGQCEDRVVDLGQKNQDDIEFALRERRTEAEMNFDSVSPSAEDKKKPLAWWILALLGKSGYKYAPPTNDLQNEDIIHIDEVHPCMIALFVAY